MSSREDAVGLSALGKECPMIVRRGASASAKRVSCERQSLSAGSFVRVQPRVRGPGSTLWGDEQLRLREGRASRAGEDLNVKIDDERCESRSVCFAKRRIACAVFSQLNDVAVSWWASVTIV